MPANHRLADPLPSHLRGRVQRGNKELVAGISSPLTDSKRRPPPYHRATEREGRASAGSRGHETPANRRDPAKTRDLAWTAVLLLVFPQCSLDLAGGSSGRPASGFRSCGAGRDPAVASRTGSARQRRSWIRAPQNLAHRDTSPDLIGTPGHCLRDAGSATLGSVCWRRESDRLRTVGLVRGTASREPATGWTAIYPLQRGEGATRSL